jgi:hypothetical protein
VSCGLLNCRSAFSAGRFYWVPLPAARQTPSLEENQGFRAFQLSPQEVLSVWSDASEPSSGKWNYEREMAEKFCRKWRLPRHFWVLLHAVKHDMGQTALLPLRRKVCWIINGYENQITYNCSTMFVVWTSYFTEYWGMRTAVHLPPCTRNNTHTNTWCCHVTHHNEILIILISDFSQEIYIFHVDDMRCAIEICRSSESVLV